MGNEGMLGFPLDYSDPKYDNSSVFDQILQQNKNEKKPHRVIAHKTLSDTQGRFFLGNYPNELTNGNLPFTRCKVNSDWSCKISYIQFDSYNKLSEGKKLGNATHSYDNAYFTFSFEEIIAPYYTLTHFNTSIFKNLINNQSCSLVAATGLTKISCNEQFMNSSKFTDIYFAFDEAAYRLNASSNLFTKDATGNYIFAVHFTNTSDWTFGTKFLKNFISVFDADSKSIGFYGTDIKDFSSNSAVMIVVIILGALILVFAILFLICLCKKPTDSDGYVPHQ